MRFDTALAAVHGPGGFPDIETFPGAQQEGLLLPQRQLADGVQCDSHQLFITCAVVASVFEPLKAIDQKVQNFLPGLWRQVVQVGEDSTHFELRMCER